MTSPVHTVAPDSTLDECMRLMTDKRIRHLPVVERGRVLGVVSWRDLPYEDRAVMQPELDQRHTLAERMW